MNILIVCASIIVYASIGAFVCGIHDEFLYIQEYMLFWPIIVVVKTIKKWRKKL